jgi:hypothetical protein
MRNGGEKRGVRTDIVDTLRRIGHQQAGLLETETGELWHPVDVLLGAADEIDWLRKATGAGERCTPCFTVQVEGEGEADGW